ncbi:hypothetical protein [Tomitella biformata]|uniref:hypothetical protein n=1 Tax=Tomitella biformata TaxID=630403 RepID=UPI000466362E|nr:hypothetical protein [Tomitella biformata]
MRNQHNKFGRPGGWQSAHMPDAADAADWLSGRLPSEWFDGPAEVTVDKEEIVIVGTLPLPAGTSAAEGEGRASRFREETRAARMAIADEGQARYGRTFSWGVRVGEQRILFTHLAVPVMTRLRQPERRVLDTLVDAGVARSRADALAWSVRLVGEHAEEWLAQLRDAMGEVEDLRAQGPKL